MLYPGITLEGMLQQYRAQYLQKKGWIRSVESHSALDEHGEPVPWLTYPAIEFLSRLIRPEWRVFEYGCGSSTLWWSQRVAQVSSVDHDPMWLDRVLAAKKTNIEVQLVAPGAAYKGAGQTLIDRYFREVTEPPPVNDEGFRLRAGLLSEPFRAYAAELCRFPSQSMDVVVIDGMARSLCTWVAIQHAMPKAMIVFDNSDRDVYTTAYNLLSDAGYRRIDFWGTGPINPYEWCSSVFLKDLQILR